MTDIETLKRIAEVEFADIVLNTLRIEYKIRITLVDNSFIDIHLSQKLPAKFGFHWECMDASGTIYRYDNFPDKKWQSIETFPYHFHNGSQDAVEASPFPSSVIDGFRAFMELVKSKIKK
jgi:hypothetical protein